MSRRRNSDTRWGRRSKRALRSIVKINKRVGDKRAKGQIDYDKGIFDLTFSEPDVLSDLGDLVREEDDDAS